MRSIFDEYDRAHVQRQQQFSQQVKSKLERLVEADPEVKRKRREAKRRRRNVAAMEGGLQYFSRPTSKTTQVLEAIAREEDDFISRKRQEITSNLGMSAIYGVLQNYFCNSFTHLVKVGYSAFAEAEESEFHQAKEAIYTRFRQALTDVQASRKTRIIMKFPGRGELTETIPQTSEEKNHFRTFLRTLTSEGYCSNKAAEKLANLILAKENPLGKETVEESHPEPITPGISSSSSKSTENITEKDRVAIRDYLTSFLQFSAETAERYTRIFVLDELNVMYERLVAHVGDDNALELLRFNPGILEYRKDGNWGMYLKTLKQMKAGISKSENPAEAEAQYGVAANLREYSRLEELLRLKHKLYGNQTTNDPSPEKEAVFNPLYYSMLHRGSVRVEQRLQKLIESGTVAVNGMEHWKEDETGARHLHILKKMGRQLTRIFAACGYEPPRCTYNFGQGTLTISPEAQKHLREIRERAYAPQKK